MECGTEFVNFQKDNDETQEIQSLDLTPAESFLILDLNADGKEMLKLTMMDLLARNVLVMDSWEEEKGFLRKKPEIVQAVGPGENFETELDIHEEIFREPLYNKQSMFLKDYVHKITEKFSTAFTRPSFSKYRDLYVRNPLIEKGYIEKIKKTTAGLISSSHYQLTDYGLQARERIQDVLEDADYLGEWVEKDPERAKAFLSAIGPHIFILNYDLDTLRYLKQKLGHIATHTARFYPYYLFPLAAYFGAKTNLDNWDDSIDTDVLVMDILDSFDSFDTFDSFDDLFDSFDSGGFDGGDGDYDGSGGE